MTSASSQAGWPLIGSLLIKPAGADCNLACAYCFYRDKVKLYPQTLRHRMSLETLESMIRQYLAISGPQASFGWQGGEPLLMGLDFFRQAVELQKKYGQPGQRIANGLQTNGLLLDDEWARFLRDYRFLVGLSLDGSAELHDAYRQSLQGHPSHERVLAAARAMTRYNVEFNALVVLSPLNVRYPAQLYDYFLGQGLRYLQFIPCAELDEAGNIASFSITAEQYGDFLCALFERWLANGQPTAYIRLFDEMLIRYVRGEFPSCTFRQACDSYVVVEYNGDVYGCDFFVEPEWYLGNLQETSLAEIVQSEKYRAFAARKGQLSAACHQCPWLSFCYGGCPKYRFIGGGHDYFCRAHRRFFAYSKAAYEQLARRFQEPASTVVTRLMRAPQRNDPCPCGSSRKYKHCCGAR